MIFLTAIGIFFIHDDLFILFFVVVLLSMTFTGGLFDKLRSCLPDMLYMTRFKQWVFLQMLLYHNIFWGKYSFQIDFPTPYFSLFIW